MSDFLSNLAARSLGTAKTIQPRIPPVYEPNRRDSGLRATRARARQIDPEAAGEEPAGEKMAVEEPSAAARRQPRPTQPPEQVDLPKAEGPAVQNSAPSEAAALFDAASRPAASPPAPASVSRQRAAPSVLTPAAKKPPIAAPKLTPDAAASQPGLTPEAGHPAFEAVQRKPKPESDSAEPFSKAPVSRAPDSKAPVSKTPGLKAPVPNAPVPKAPVPKAPAVPVARVTSDGQAGPENGTAHQARASQEAHPAPPIKRPETPDIAPMPPPSNVVAHSNRAGELPAGAFGVEIKSASQPAEPGPGHTASSLKPPNIARRVMATPARPQAEPESLRSSVAEHFPSSSEPQPEVASRRFHRGETTEPSPALTPAAHVPVPPRTQTPTFPVKPASRTDQTSESPVKITIGKVEVRAVFPEQPARRTPPPRSRRTVSLDDYLKQSNSGNR